MEILILLAVIALILIMWVSIKPANDVDDNQSSNKNEGQTRRSERE